MAVYEMYVESASGAEHRLRVDFDYSISNDGIGPYEFWGASCYDAGTDFLDDVKMNSIELIREEPVKNEDGSFQKDFLGCIRRRRAAREICIGKLTCVDPDEIVRKIRDHFDWRADLDDFRASCDNR